MGHSRTNDTRLEENGSGQSEKHVRKSHFLHSYCCFQSLSALWYGWTWVTYAEDWIQHTKDIPRMVPQVVSNVEPSEEGLGDVEARQKRQDPPGDFFRLLLGSLLRVTVYTCTPFYQQDMASGRSTNACCHRLSILQTMHVLRFRCTYYFRILYFGILPVVFGSHIFGIPLPEKLEASNCHASNRISWKGGRLQCPPASQPEASGPQQKPNVQLKRAYDEQTSHSSMETPGCNLSNAIW